MRLRLRNARWLGAGDRLDLAVEGGQVVAGSHPDGASEIDLEDAVLLPGLVNAHDHLDFSTFPPLGRPPYRSLYEWAADVEAGSDDPRARAALSVTPADRLFLGGLRNLLAGVTAVVHHGPFHRSLDQPEFPTRVLARYGFAHSPGLTARLRDSYRTSDRRIPWMIHAGEGTDDACRAELDRLAAANVLRQNTLVVHGIAFSSRDAARMAEANACLVWCPESNQRLYGATADVQAFLQAGVRVGLGSDSPVSGVRDALSNMAVARGLLQDDGRLIELATTGSAVVARLPGGGREPLAPADFLAVRSLDALLAGDRRSIALVVVAGRARYGEGKLMAAAGVPVTAVEIDGEARALDRSLARRAARILRSFEGREAVAWLAPLRFETEGRAPRSE